MPLPPSTHDQPISLREALFILGFCVLIAGLADGIILWKVAQS